MSLIKLTKKSSAEGLPPITSPRSVRAVEERESKPSSLSMLPRWGGASTLRIVSLPWQLRVVAQ